MPSRFVRVEIIKVEEGSSITGLSAYVRREARVDLDGHRFNFRHRADELVDSGLVLPEGAPEWAEDGERLWQEATAAELVKDRETGEIRFRKNAQVARHMVIALPIEATEAERADLVRRWIAEEIRPQEHQVAVEWAIHRDDKNPHAHILISTRTLGPDGFGKKARGMNPEFGSRGKLHFISEQDDWDGRWAAFQERYFAEHRIEAEVRERRPVQEPHMGAKRFVRPEIKEEVNEVRAVNAEFAAASARDPAEVLAALTKRKAVFTETDLRRYCARRQIFGQERETLLEAVRSHAEILKLYDDQGKKAGYTTRQVRRQEEAVLALAAQFADERLSEAQGVRGRLDETGLSMEQRLAVRSLSGESRFALLIGRAGTGKTHTLNPVRRAYEAAGFEAVGLAPTNTVAADLRAQGFKLGATLHRELRAVESGRRQWSSRTVVIVDEAAMVDSETLARLFKAVAESGALLRLVGDDRQFESVARGGLFSEMVRRHRPTELREVRRQPEAWQARASEDYAAGNIHSALAAYAARGAVQFTGTQEEARQALLAVVAADERAAPGKMRFIYASTNEEVDKLNAARQASLRAEKAAKGAMASKWQSFETVRGETSIAAGERVQFYATDHAVGVFTAEFGTVRLVQKDRIEVEKDNGQRIAFDPRQFTGWGLGYAGTVYKGQGKTQPETYALYDHPYAWDSRAAYVTGTRHVDRTRLFVSRQLAPDLATLAAQITRPREYRGSSMRYEARAPGAAPSPAEQVSARFQDMLDQSAKARAAEKAQQEAEAARHSAEAAERAAAEQARRQPKPNQGTQKPQQQGPKAGSTHWPSVGP